MSTCGRGADGRMRGSAPPARIRGSRARPGGRYFLIHRTKAFQPVLARLSGRFGPSVSYTKTFGVISAKPTAGGASGRSTVVAWCVTHSQGGAGDSPLSDFGNQKGVFDLQKGDFVWSNDQRKIPCLRASWRIAQNRGPMVSRHCPLVLTAMVGHTNVLCTCRIMRQNAAKANWRRSSSTAAIGWCSGTTTRWTRCGCTRRTSARSTCSARSAPSGAGPST